MKRMARAATAALLGLGAWPASAASLTYYNDRAAFDAAEPGLALQSFDAANLSGQAYVTQASPLNAATNNSVFVKGSIQRGLAINTRHPGSRATALLVYAGGPVTSKSVGNNWFGDTLVLNFPQGVGAVGEDVFGNTSSGTSLQGRISEQVFAGSELIGTRTLTEAAGASIFFGVSSATQPITRVQISWASDNDASTFVSDIEFGTPASR